MPREIPTKDYMVDGWDRGPIGCHPYKRGSKHNRRGMWVMWLYYILITFMVIRLILVLNT